MITLSAIVVVVISCLIVISLVAVRFAGARADCAQWQDAAFEMSSGPETKKIVAPALDTITEDTLMNQVFKDSRGTESSYHVFNHGIDADKPVGVLIHLHGDGGGEYDSPQGFATCASALAAEHNMVTVVPRTPDTETDTWWQDMNSNQHWLNELSAKVINDFNIDRNQIWWSGYSGGAEFLSYSMLHKNPDLVTGGAIMMAGGGAPTWVNKNFDQGYLANTPLYWVVGELDDGSTSIDGFDALSAAREGSKWYREQGFNHATLNVIQNHDHYSLPTIDVLQDTLQQLLSGSETA